MSLEIHHLQLSQSERILWLLEEMQVPYKLVIYKRDPQSGLAPAELKALNPAGTAPFLRDVSVTPPVSLIESGAIVQYILEVYGPKAPGNRMIRQPGDADYGAYLNWLHFSNASLMLSLSRCSVFVMLDALDGPGADFRVGRFRHYLRLIDDNLAKNKYLAGEEVTAADCMTVTILTTIRGWIPYKLTEFPNILRYLRDVAARPAFKEALRKGESDGRDPMVDAEVPRFTQFPAFAAMLTKTPGIL